ncbi:MAG: hypothetical protein IJ348_03880, partial [Alistipes sp.]|nr:hypothetical protein [Alistipes sp.]MBQ7856239.1 hypothetical protein [Alistipes sp.]
MKKIYTLIYAVLSLILAGCTTPLEDVEALPQGGRLDFYVAFDGQSRITLGDDMCYAWEGDER